MSNPDKCFGISLNPSNRLVRKRNTSSTSCPSSTRKSDQESQVVKDKEKEPTLLWWKIIVVVSCVTAVLADPLFLYIPLINDKSKCLGMDKTLRIFALLLRSLTDVIFIMDIVQQVRERNKTMAEAEAEAEAESRSSSEPSLRKDPKVQAKEQTSKKRQFYVSMTIHILALLPLPQVSVLVVFFRTRDSRYLPKLRVLNVILLLQYVPNIVRVGQSYKKLKLKGKFVRGAFNFFLYIVASHVLGAFWYYFSVEREISCWLQACKNIAGCIVTRCGGDSAPTHAALLDGSCPINPSNATMFNFGMFLETIQSGYTRQISFPNKFFYSFWWGLKNLSNFGTNLETSSYTWENCFAILISITGLLLFLYLIGNVQAYMQFSKSKEMDDEELSKKLLEKEDAIRRYLTPTNGLPQEITEHIMANIKYDMLKRRLDSAVDMDLLISVVPWNVRDTIKQNVGLMLMKKVPMLQRMDREVLENMCKHLKPVRYRNGDKFLENNAIQSMLFITEGEIIPILPSQEKLDPDHQEKNELEKLDCCFGVELLTWVSPSISCANLDHPKMRQSVECQNNVEALALQAEDLKTVVNEFSRKWNWGLYRCDTDSPDQFPRLHKSYEEYIESWEKNLARTQKDKISKEIIEWLESTCLSDTNLTQKIQGHIQDTHVEKKDMDAAMDLGNIFLILPQDIRSIIAMKALRNVDLFKKMPDSMLEHVSKYLEPVIYPEKSYVVKAEDKLEVMLFVIEGLIVCTNASMDVATTESYMIPKLFLERGTIYGEKLLSWASSSSSSVADLPISTQEFKCLKRAEAFSLKASELKDVVSRYGNKWSEYFTAPNHDNKTYLQKLKEVHMQLTATTRVDNEEFKQQMEFMTKEKKILEWLLTYIINEDVTTKVMKHIIENKVVEKKADLPVDVVYLLSVDLPLTIEKHLLDHLCMRTLKNVPMLNDMPEDILDSICGNLNPVVYQKDKTIVEKGKALDLMLIIIEGEVILSDLVIDEAGTGNSSVNPQRLGKGDYFGDKLLNWFSPANKLTGPAPISTQKVFCQTKVEAFVLTREKLISVVSDHNSGWMSKFKNIDDASQLTALNCSAQWIDEGWPSGSAVTVTAQGPWPKKKSGEQHSITETSITAPQPWKAYPCVAHIVDRPSGSVVIETAQGPSPKKKSGEQHSMAETPLKGCDFANQQQLLVTGTAQPSAATWRRPIRRSPLKDWPSDSEVIETVHGAWSKKKSGEQHSMAEIPLKLNSLGYSQETVALSSVPVQKPGITNVTEIVDEEAERQVKIKNKEKEIEEWVSSNGFDEELKTKIRFHIKIINAVEENIDAEVDVGYIFSLKLPWIDIAKPITEHLCMDTLKRVPMLQKMPEDVLKKMCFHMEAVVYKENRFVVHERDVLDFVLIIVDGVIEWTVASGDAGPASSTLITKKRGDFFGERLLNWASPKTMFSGSAPTSTRDVRCQTKVEAFRITTKNLISVVSEYDLDWNSKFIDCTDPQQIINEV